MNIEGVTVLIPTPYYKQISEYRLPTSIMLRPRFASAFESGSQRSMPVLPNAVDRKVVAEEVSVVLSLNSKFEEVKREHVTKTELLKRREGGQ